MTQLRRFNDEFLQKLNEEKYFGITDKGWIHILEKLEDLISEEATYDSTLATHLFLILLNISH